MLSGTLRSFAPCQAGLIVERATCCDATPVAIAHVASGVPGGSNLSFPGPRASSQVGIASQIIREMVLRRRHIARCGDTAHPVCGCARARRHNNFVHAGITPQAFASLAEHHVLSVFPGGESGAGVKVGQGEIVGSASGRSLISTKPIAVGRKPHALISGR